MRISNMSLISFEKQDDAQTLRDLWDIIGSGMNVYVRSERQDILDATQEVIAFADRLKARMDMHDYTEDDARRQRVEKLLKYENK